MTYFDRRRAGDPDDEDHTASRRSNGVDVAWGAAHLRIFGPVGVMFVCVLLTMGALVYVNWAGFQDLHVLQTKISDDHRILFRAQDITACVLSLSAEERGRTRGLNTRDDFAHLCPWMRPP